MVAPERIAAAHGRVPRRRPGPDPTVAGVGPSEWDPTALGAAAPAVIRVVVRVRHGAAGPAARTWVPHRAAPVGYELDRAVPGAAARDPAVRRDTATVRGAERDLVAVAASVAAVVSVAAGAAVGVDPAPAAVQGSKDG
ncbi:hypothetical protein AB0C34_08245 [Nocardia sp. NPDC049220]|uniref:hypothetical protein n=1 Tax=Nocardia sp. NPDC049220 TaxID=3155273 RepID=UPI0033E2CC1A